jgi:hypothetical protein
LMRRELVLAAQLKEPAVGGSSCPRCNTPLKREDVS